MKIEQEIKQKRFENEWQKLSINLTFTFGWARDQLRQIFAAYDLTMQQYNILRILRGQHPQPISTSDIRSRMLDKMSDTSRLVDRLCKKGLVERNPCSSDKRLVDVLISKEGIELMKKLDDQQEEMYSIYHNLTPSEAHQLNQLLDKLRG